MELRFYSHEGGGHMLLGKHWYSPSTLSTEETYDVGLEHKGTGRDIIKTPIYHSWNTGYIVLTVPPTSPS